MLCWLAWYCKACYCSPFILSNIWSLPDLSLPLPVTLPRAVSLHIRGRGRQVGAERCMERRMKFLADTTGWGGWWECRREHLMFVSNSKANWVRRGWIAPSYQSRFVLPLQVGKDILPLSIFKGIMSKKSTPTQSPSLPCHRPPSVPHARMETTLKTQQKAVFLSPSIKRLLT